MVLLFLYLSVNCRAAMQKIRNEKLAQSPSKKLNILITYTYQCDLHAKYNNIQGMRLHRSGAPVGMWTWGLVHTKFWQPP
jgi:hypothetical protein